MGRSAPLRLGIGESEYRVSGTPGFECTCLLKILAFAVDSPARKCVECLAREHGRTTHLARNALARLVNRKIFQQHRDFHLKYLGGICPESVGIDLRLRRASLGYGKSAQVCSKC